MKIAIMQPYLFPYIGYYQMINCVDTFVILDDVQYIRRGWINRNNLSKSDTSDEKSMFTVPTKKASRNSLIKDIEISNEYLAWKSKFFKTLNRRYSKAKNFKKIESLLQNILNKNHTHISDLATDSLIEVSKFLNIKTSFILSSNIPTEGQFDKKLINICKYLGAPNYINSIGGKELYTKEMFSDYGININFIKSNDAFNYYSIIDLLMRGADFSLSDYILE